MTLSHPRKLKTVLILLGIVFFTSVYLIRIREDMADFRVNYRAGARLLAGESLYRSEDGHFMFKYLPFSALLYLPLSLLPLEAAKVIWYMALVVGSVCLFHLSRKIAHSQTGRGMLSLFPPLILAKFFLREMKLGQINIVVTLVLLSMVWFLISAREGASHGGRRAGALWGLATALKPYGLIFLPYLALRKQWTALAAGAGAILVALLLPSFFYGFTGNLLQLREWISTLAQSTPALLVSNDNVSIAAFFMKWTGEHNLSLLLMVATAALLALLLLLVVRAGSEVEEPVALECSLLLTLIPLISPLGWDYTFLMSALAVTILVKHHAHFSGPCRILLVSNFCVIALSVYDVMGPTYYGMFMSWSILTLNFVMVVGFLVALRFRRIA